MAEDALSEEELERIFGPVRHLREESGPVTLSAEYLAAVERVEALPQNRPGADKGWVERSLRAFREHYGRTVRVR